MEYNKNTLNKSVPFSHPYFSENPHQNLIFLAKQIRKDVLKWTHLTNSAHLGSCFSVIEILTALYATFLKVDPTKTRDSKRDRFILSKGHACLALYCTLYRQGFISESVLERYGIDGGTLEHHNKMNLDYGIELSTGSLGHGLPVATGMAHVGRQEGFRVVTVLSDGELNEGSNWEAIQFASQHKLENLFAIVDCNKIQALGNTADIMNLNQPVLTDKWKAFGWAAVDVDGHNFAQILAALKDLSEVRNQPKVIVAHTVKGKGVSFMENQLLWHYRCPDAKEYEMALKELENV